jgi:hypothetical protein
MPDVKITGEDMAARTEQSEQFLTGIPDYRRRRHMRQGTRSAFGSQQSSEQGHWTDELYLSEQVHTARL